MSWKKGNTLQLTLWHNLISIIKKRCFSEKDGREKSQGMTYCIKFTILYKDCLVMKKIGNRLITEANTDFSNH